MRNLTLMLVTACAMHFGCGITEAQRCTDAPSQGQLSLRRAPGYVLEATIALPKMQYNLRSLDVTDLDADGRLDLLVTSEETTWYRGVGEPLEFAEGVVLVGPLAFGGSGLALGDIKGEGRTEAVVWQDDQVSVLEWTSGEFVSRPLWVSPEGAITGVNIDEVAQQMIVSSNRLHTVLDLSMGEPQRVGDIAVSRQSEPLRLLDLDGRIPNDFISPNSGQGSVVTFRDGRATSTVTIREEVRDAALLRTRWSSRTLVTLADGLGHSGELWLRELGANGSGPATVWSWAEEGIEGISVVDVEPDGYDELILHYENSAVLVWVVETGAIQIIGRIGETIRRTPWHEGGSIAADLDDDGRAEIVLIGPDNTLEIYSGPEQAGAVATCIMPQLPGCVGSSLSWD